MVPSRCKRPHDDGSADDPRALVTGCGTPPMGCSCGAGRASGLMAGSPRGTFVRVAQIAVGAASGVDVPPETLGCPSCHRVTTVPTVCEGLERVTCVSCGKVLRLRPALSAEQRAQASPSMGSCPDRVVANYHSSTQTRGRDRRSNRRRTRPHRRSAAELVAADP